MGNKLWFQKHMSGYCTFAGRSKKNLKKCWNDKGSRQYDGHNICAMHYQRIKRRQRK